MDKYEAVVKSLQERSQQVLPLRYRREPPPQPIPVEALCEYEGEQVPPPPAQGPAEVLPGPSPQGAREWKWHCGREQVFSKPWWLLQLGARQRSPSPRWEEQVLQRRSRRGLGEARPPCLSHTLGTLRQHSSVTFPRSLC